MITIDTLKEKYIDALCEIENASFSNAWAKESFISEMSNPTSVFFVALKGGEVAGCVAMNNALGEGFISKLMVSKKSRRQGIGFMLLERLCEYAEHNAMFALTLEVRESNAPAVALYEKAGFKNLGKRKNFYRNPKEDAVIMTKKFTKEFTNENISD